MEAVEEDSSEAAAAARLPREVLLVEELKDDVAIINYEN